MYIVHKGRSIREVSGAYANSNIFRGEGAEQFLEANRQYSAPDENNSTLPPPKTKKNSALMKEKPGHAPIVHNLLKHK